MPDLQPPPANWKQHVVRLAKLGVLLLVAWFIWRFVDRARAEFQQSNIDWRAIHPWWLAVAGLFYVLASIPSWIYWHCTIVTMGQRPRWAKSAQAFFIGHLGKYVPGKALVVAIRANLVHSPQVNWAIASAAVFVETLTFMAVGAFIAAGLLIFVNRDPQMIGLAILLMLAAGVPTLPPIFRRLVLIVGAKKVHANIDAEVSRLNYRLLAIGWAGMTVGWLLMGLSLWATLNGLSTALEISGLEGDMLPQIAVLTASVALATVAGFLSMLPGGIGVREYVVMTLLVPVYGPVAALMSAVVLRLVWLLSELVVSAILYVVVRAEPEPSEAGRRAIDHEDVSRRS